MHWELFLTTYFLIFLMELPDKTALSVLLLSTKHHGVAVFMGAALAFVIQCLVAVTFGSLFSFLPKPVTHIAAGLLFLYFAFRLWQESRESCEAETTVPVKPSDHFRQSFINSFVMIFVAEWGDLTQLATAALQVKYHDIWSILTGSILALWSVTLVCIIAGKSLKKWLEPQKLQLIGAVIFAIVGIYFLVTAIDINSL